jgi:phosphoribosylformylglycinamidine synthase I
VTAAVIVFPGSNCDRDAAVAIERAMGKAPLMVWHRETHLPDVDLIVLPGGFSYGDYLRAGALAARSPIMKEVVARAEVGVAVLGICNGFQILTESGLLPGAILRNAGLHFVCRTVALRVENNRSRFTEQYALNEVVHIPVAHHDGNFRAAPETLNRLEGEGLVAFRYCDDDGDPGDSPNGAARNIAGILNDAGNVLGMMPHPERVADARLGGTDGAKMFDGLAKVLA